jgi:hypothetical protein
MSADHTPPSEPEAWGAADGPVPPFATPPPARPGPVTASGIILLGLGGLLVLLGLLFVITAPLMGDLANDPDFVAQFGDISDSLQSFALTLGIVMGLFGGVQLVAGAFVLQRRTWARVTGMICAVLGGLFALLFVFSGQPVSAAIGLVVVGSYGYAFWALTTRGSAFGAR